MPIGEWYLAGNAIVMATLDWSGGPAFSGAPVRAPESRRTARPQGFDFHSSINVLQRGGGRYLQSSDE